jgi:hypothetical protein
MDRGERDGLCSQEIKRQVKARQARFELGQRNAVLHPLGQQEGEMGSCSRQVGR